MMNFFSIASGSSGNCSFIGSDKATLLVDVGISKKKIVEGLNQYNYDLKDLDGILITHEHIDHIKGLGVISRGCGIPIYATSATCEAIKMTSSIGEIDESLFRPIDVDDKFMIGDISVYAHSIWHDAADPVCYSFMNQNKKICIATDMGDYDEYIVGNLMDSDLLLIEANHDIRMLQAGAYPYNLKQRILGKRGHLSNEASGRLIRNIMNNHLKAVFLGHLSKDNNYPELAYETVKCELDGNPYTNDVRDINLQVASRNACSDLINI